MLELQQQNPAEIILFRRKIRRSFDAWCRYRMSKQDREPALHHKLVIHTIEQLLKNELGYSKVIFLMPPGSAKSTYTSQLLPAWFCNPEQFPTELMLACSYSYSLIEDFGKIARDMVEEESAVLGIEPSKTSWAAGNWRTNRGGGYYCAGVNAGIAGRRARLGLIDDYIGSEEEADSKLIRDKNWKWYWNDFNPRLLPHAWQFLIANRRHEDDLVGRLLNHKSSKDWLVIRLPMLAEDDDILGRKVGERLWPEWFTEQQVEEAKVLPRTWAGLYQQRPAPDEGNYFRKEWIVKRSLKDYPPKESLRFYCGADYAVRKNSVNDRFCFLPAGVDSDDNIWIWPSWYWMRADSGEAVEAQLRLSKEFSFICWWAGRENITGSIAPFLYKRMQETGIYVPVEELPEGKDKQAKAQAIRGRMAAKKVFFPDVPEFADAEHELLTFPGGLHDDFIDAMAKIGQGLLKIVGNSPLPTEKKLEEILNPPLTYQWLCDSDARRNRMRTRHTCEV